MKTRKERSNRYRFTRKNGGKVIESGGFGCVFKPALKCINKSKREKNKVTKLMTKNKAISEYDLIMEIRQKLNKIKNYKDYFIINDLTLCKPSKLIKSDLNNFKKCTALPKSNITKKNINKSLHKMLALTIPDGGIAIDDYIDGNPLKDFKVLNARLMDLLLHGIIPMNEKHIYHNDIKTSNVLVKNTNDKLLTRLIDWGLSTEYLPFQSNKIPSVLRNKPLQYNLPFSLILFADDFNIKYAKFLQKKKDNHKDIKRLKLFMKKFIYYWVKTRGKGHYVMIRYLIFILHNTQNRKEERNISSSTLETYDSSTEVTTNSEDIIKNTIEDENALRTIINYIVPILTEFTEGNSLNLTKYLNNVYIHLVDVYGFINIYCPLMEALYKKIAVLTENQILIFKLIKGLYTKYLYSPTNKPINIDDLITDLKKLDVLFENENENEI
jgi:serine/threonine protein kinase